MEDGRAGALSGALRGVGLGDGRGDLRNGLFELRLGESAEVSSGVSGRSNGVKARMGSDKDTHLRRALERPCCTCTPFGVSEQMIRIPARGCATDKKFGETLD